MAREISNKSVSPMNPASASFTPQMRAGTASKQNFLGQQGRFPPTVHHVQRLVDDDIKAVFYSDVAGINPTIACICSDKELPEAKVLKNARTTTTITSKGAVAHVSLTAPIISSAATVVSIAAAAAVVSLATVSSAAGGVSPAVLSPAVVSIAALGLARCFSCVITMH